MSNMKEILGQAKNVRQLLDQQQHVLARTGLPVRPHERFNRAGLDARHALSTSTAQHVWNPDHLLREVGL